MLRYYYRFILLNSRKLIPSESVVDRNINHMRFQSCRSTCSATSQRIAPPSLDSELAQIFAASASIPDLNENEIRMIDNVLEKYANGCFTDFVPQILCEATSLDPDDKLRKMLRSVVYASNNPRAKEYLTDEVNEILSLIPDFTTQHPSTYISRNLLYDFIKTSCNIYGPKKVAEVIDQIKNLFSPGARHFSRLQLLPLFESLFNHSDTDFISASKVCNALINIDMVRDRKVFLEVAARYLITKLQYDDAFYKWSSACSIDNIISGGDIFLEHVLSDKKLPIKFQQRRIKQLVKFYEQILSPSDVIAQLIVSLCSTGRAENAKELWMNVDVDCKYFLSPVYKLKNDKFVDVNLIHIRDFAQLLEECVLAELKKKKKPRKKKTVVESEEDEMSEEDAELEAEEMTEAATVEPKAIPVNNMAFLLKEWQPHKKRYKNIKQKIKKFDVKADQMEALVNAIQEVWVWLIELKNDPKVASPDEMEKFLARNNIPLAEKLHQRVQKLKEKQKKVESLKLKSK